MALVTTCPYCKVPTQFLYSTKWGTYQTWRCSVCNKFVFFIMGKPYEERITKEDIVDQYPKVIPELDSSIPEKIRNDMIEALKCFDINCLKASVTMARRALQNAVRDKEAKGENLKKEIDDLASKHIITPALKSWAHEIRELGNIGAHPEKDGLDKVTKEDAQEILNFAEDFLKYVYVMPARVEARRAKKNKEK